MDSRPRRARTGLARLPVGGRVVYGGIPYIVAAVKEATGDTYAYTLRPVNPAGRVLSEVTHAMVVRQLEAFAQYQVGQVVQLGNGGTVQVIHRHWDFRTGAVWYYAGNQHRDKREGWYSQEAMKQFDQNLDPGPDA